MKTFPAYLFLITSVIATGISAQNSVKWEETFDDPALPPGWQLIDNDQSGSGLQLVSTTMVGGETAILPQAGQYFFSGNVQNANLAGVIDEWLISPRISVIYAGDSLYFWAGAVGELFDDSLRVLISTTGNMPADFTTELGKFRVDGPAGHWQRYGFDLTAFDSSDIHFALNYLIRDGGPGGQHSDQIWIDHPVISGDPVTLNAPPSPVTLQTPVDGSNLDISAPAVNFSWSAATDADSEPLTYTLSIVNVFPQMHFTGITDTVFRLNWKDLLNDNTGYRWTVEATDGKSKIASPDTFSFRLADPAAVAAEEGRLPAEPVLFQNYPNPFNPVTVISWQLAVGGYVDLSVYDISGRRVAVLASREMGPGNHSHTFDGRSLPSGVYYYQLAAGSYSEVRKMMLLR